MTFFIKENDGMKSGKRSNVSRVGYWAFVAIILISSTSWAIPVLKVTNVQLNLFAEESFNQFFSAGDGEFSISQNYISDPDKVIGQVQVQGDTTYLYEIRGGAVTLSPSEFDYELHGETDLFGGARAIAHFLQGATLTVTGSVWDVSGATDVEVSPYGTVMEAAVQADFYVFEHAIWTNEIAAQLNMFITGGDLATGAQGLQSLYNGLTNDITLYSCQQGVPPVAPVVSFAEDMIYTDSSSIMQIYFIPEPATVVLLGLGAVMLRKKKL